MRKNPATDSVPQEEAFLTNSALYKEFLAEREEILRHKWLQSEQKGRDIGFEDALLDWMVNHRSEWHADRHAAR